MPELARDDNVEKKFSKSDRTSHCDYWQHLIEGGNLNLEFNELNVEGAIYTPCRFSYEIIAS